MKLNIERGMDLLGKVPTTQARMITTLLLIVATAGRYFSSNVWVPTESWLMFLGGLSGIDVAHFASKRWTQIMPDGELAGAKIRNGRPSTSAPVVVDDGVTNTTDVQEYNNSQLG